MHACVCIFLFLTVSNYCEQNCLLAFLKWPVRSTVYRLEDFPGIISFPLQEGLVPLMCTQWTLVPWFVCPKCFTICDKVNSSPESLQSLRSKVLRYLTYLGTSFLWRLCKSPHPCCCTFAISLRNQNLQLGQLGKYTASQGYQIS